MNKRDAVMRLKQAREMLKQLDEIQESQVMAEDATLWSVATAARWAVSALEDILWQKVNK